MTLFTLTSILALSLIPGGLASPTGVRVRSSSDTCLSKCRPNWGWPGYYFSDDPWGSVVDLRLSSQSDDESGHGVGGVEADPSPDSPDAASTAILTAPVVLGTSPALPYPIVSAPDPERTVNTLTSHVSLPTVTKAKSPPPPPTAKPKAPPPPHPTKPVARPQSPPAGGSGSGSGPTSGSDIQAYLAGHNNVRAKHGAAPLTYSQDLASKAQQWVNGCKFVHSGGKLGPFGENLAAGTGDNYGIQEALKSWTDEASQYNPNNPQPSHFTQVVWKGTTQVGCAMQMCDGIFSSSFGKARYYVCEYSKQGNVIGEFDQNVQA